MAINTKQRAARQRFIGSSDSAAILGVDPYRSAGDVWLEKTGKVEPFAGNADTDRGNLLEPVILTWAEQQLGAPLVRDVFIPPTPDLPFMGANLDALIEGDGRLEIVEAKSSVNADEWGEQGTDEIPERVIVQVHHAMLLRGAGCRIAHVPVLIPGFKSFDWRMYRVMRNDEICAIIVERGEEFWEKHVKRDIEPSGFKPSLEVLKRMRREPNKIVPVDAALVDAVIVARAMRKQADEESEAADAALIAALGDADAGTYGPGLRFTYHTTKRAGYVVKPTEYRSLRFPKNPKPRLTLSDEQVAGMLAEVEAES